MFIFYKKSPVSPGRLRAARRGLWQAGIALIFGTLVLATSAGTAWAAGTRQYTAAAGGSLIINGTSTFHNWTAKTTALTGNAVFSGKWTGRGNAALKLQSINLVIAVKSIKSSEGGGMDDTMYSALDLKHHALITYELTKAHLLTRPASATAAAVFNTTGTLRVDGVTKTVPLVLTATPTPGGGVSITTKLKLKMTTFGVKPPTAMFGVIRSGNAITITATWPLAVKAGA
ncbi:MAG: YceI family protein [Phycisphaerae bacterium]